MAVHYHINEVNVESVINPYGAWTGKFPRLFELCAIQNNKETIMGFFAEEQLAIDLLIGLMLTGAVFEWDYIYTARFPSGKMIGQTPYWDSCIQ